MKYNPPKGYALVTDKSREIAKKYNLTDKLEKKLYRLLLDTAKTTGKKYSDSKNCRIWLLNLDTLNEKKLLNELNNTLDGQVSLFDFIDLDEYKNEFEKSPYNLNFNGINTVELISKLRKSSFNNNEFQYILQLILSNQNKSI